MVKTHSFNHVVYDIDIEPCYGSCGHPHGKGKPSIRINVEDENCLLFLETILHESLHASYWNKSEKRVAQTARDIARLLWRLGFRKGK